MKKPAVLTGLWFGLLLTAALIAVSYFAYELVGLPFIPFDVFDWMTNVLPGPVITFGIDTMIDTMRALGIDVADTAKTAEQIMAVLGTFVPGVIGAVVFFAVLNRLEKSPTNLIPGLILGIIAGVPMLVISLVIGFSSISPVLRGLWIMALFLGWGLMLNWTYNYLRVLPEKRPTEEAPPQADEAAPAVEQISRREFLIRVGAGTAAVTVLGMGAGVALAAADRRRSRAEAAAGEVIAEVTPEVEGELMPAPGTRPEITPLVDHYKVFIRTEPTMLDVDQWTLRIHGLVDQELSLTLDDLRNNYEPVNLYVTLSCISGRVGTGLIGTLLWTGANLKEVLADAGLQDGAKYLRVYSADGFHETVDLSLVDQDDRIMLAYAWDGRLLPADHGAPLRIYIPDRYGMKQPKWITDIEVVGEYEQGYWVERGWDEVAQMKATSVIDTVAVDAAYKDESGQSLIPIGGMAHAGARGISTVEVRVDGDSWQEAELRTPLSDVTWVIWRYDWPFEAGKHTFEVRCAEGDGTPQIEEVHEARPSGSTGIHSVEVEV
jgi:DMSO/TMAO reductase YedYZ molybdopterin-dependent catalytic subunit